MPTIDFSEFIWFVPRAKEELFITIPNPGCINLNPKLAAMMPERITIGFKGVGEICIRSDDAGYSVPKSGSVRASDHIAGLIKKGLSIPAKYLVTAGDAYWTGTLESKSVPTVVNPSKISPRPRKKNLNRLIDKGEPR